MTQGPLPLVLLAAKGHPDCKFREHLWVVLNSWLDSQSPRLSRDLVENLLNGEKGTFIEPFMLNSEDMRIAVFLVMLALSNGSHATRFRICSADTVGSSGGLVITQSGASFYSERHVFGKNHLINSNMLFFAPEVSVAGPCQSQNKERIFASMRSDENGLYVDLPAEALQRIGWMSTKSEHQLKSLVATLLKNSVIGPKLLPLNALNVDILANNDGLCIAVTKPESLIRFSGYIVQGDFIQIKANNDFEIAVELPKTAEGPAPITIVAGDTFATDWMNVEGLAVPMLEPADIAEISDWAFNHVHWLNLDSRNA